MEIKPKFAVRAHGHWGREARPHCNRDGWRGQEGAKSSCPFLWRLLASGRHALPV